MACANSVPTLYRSVIEDVIERVRNLFAEEGIEEQVLKDLKQLWETKILQSKATDDFFRNSIHSPLFTLQLPHGLHQTLQTSAAPLVIPPGRTIPSFTTAELGTSNSSANFTFPSGISYPIHVPAGVTLRTASGHLYKVNVPIIVTQTPGRASILQHPVQQIFQQLGQPPVIQMSLPQLSSSPHTTTEKPQGLEPVFQQPTVLHPGTVDRKHVENVTTDVFVPPGNEHKIMLDVSLSQQESPQYVNLPGVVFAPQVSQLDSNVESALSVSTTVTQNLRGRPYSAGPRGALHQHLPDVQLRVLKNRVYGCDSVKQPRNVQEPSSLPVSEKDSNSQKDLSTPATDDDIHEIIQIDGAGDTSSNEEIGSSRDVEENDFLRMIDAAHLKLLEEEGDGVSNGDSTVNSSGNRDPQTGIVEEDPLNSGDDDSEQDMPDLFDTDNVIVCQYDKVHRNKNKWKFYLKDGVMCFGGKDYVFAKAVGDAEW
ncbi:TFIIA-alpha and beta-like factor isoform X1 [Elephas maximus indicus]|uniref:TFIIA-alpha and beta-like factor isoform X1 n=1 Tax=Elephas maximus indicus TaxID=99487 RepID=UPI00211727A3|nr:TFIIA-alpha and beta-like factor isoform X1 [Elephas maximus indicus]